MIRRSDFDVPLPGRRKPWKKPANSKFTPQLVREIRERHARGESQHKLARVYNVTQPAISYIVRGLRWADVS